jgi:diguanylate cyclase (GGDEF)-like protein/PAS domain S-box-containing protein
MKAPSKNRKLAKASATAAAPAPRAEALAAIRADAGCRQDDAGRFSIEQQQRFRAAVDMSPDLVLLVDPLTMSYVDVNETACRALGYSREELLSMGPQDIFSMPREEFAAAYARLIAGEPGGTAEGSYRCKDGSQLVVEAFRHALPTADGHVIVSTARDIGGRKRAEQLLALEHGITRALAHADSVSAALKTAMRAICESEGWECGRYFSLDEKPGVLRFAEAWSVPGETMDRFIAKSREVSYAPGSGLIGTVWQSGQPLWIADIAKDGRVHKGIAREIGMHGAFFFLLTTGGKTIGVLSFHSREVREPEERLLQAINVIGSQIGQFVQRKQAEEVMRESEERFRSLTELSSDWYWEQDENFRFTRMTNATGGQGPTSGIGQTRWDNAALNMTEADWAAHRAVLEAHQPFRDLELQRLTRDGKSRYTSVSGEPMFDRSGAFRGYRGVGKDITARKRVEQLRALEQAVNRRIAESDSASAGLKAAIRAVCEAEGWECGRYFAVDEPAGLLRFAEAWSTGGEAVERFIAASRDRVYRSGEGLSGSAWESGQALWSADVTTDPRSSSGASKARPTHDMGMHGTFVFPLRADGRTIGVLSFASRDAREPEPQLLDAIHAIGSQIGQFVKRKQAEEVVRESEERFRSLTLLSSDMYWEQDEALRFTKFSGTGSPRVNQAHLPYIGKKRWEQSYVNMTAEDWEQHTELLEARKPFRDMELCRLDEAGKKVWISISGEPVFDASGRFKGYRGVGKEVTERKNNEERIQYLANHDALTGLPNRAMFSEVLNLALHNARRYGRGFAVLFVDLDRFKVINDTLGHEAGDNLLKEMTQRLTATVRASDFVARLGGDEFVVLVQEVSEGKQAEVVARKILAAFARPLAIQGQEYRVTASIGICMYPGDAQDEQALMKNADIAMYRAKEEGKNTYKFYSAEANIHSFERLALETALRRGLERNEFFLHYQAKLDLASGEISGVEALVRWQHPDLGIVPPAQFIPLAEETGLIVPLGKWVLRTACAQNAAWQREGLPPLRMSVNISARQFADEELLEDIAAALAESGMDAELLELELTESMVMQHPERATAILHALKRTGVRLAIDDFGVGYSSLTHLKRFPIDTLKVDRSFIRDIPQNSEDRAITEAIIAMGKSLDLTIVAEGVETLEQQTFLQEHHCDEMQGFYFSKPIPSEQFAQLLRKRIARAK